MDPVALRLGFIVYGAMNRKDWRTVRLEDVVFERTELENELLPVLRADTGQSRKLDDLATTLLTDCRRNAEPLVSFTAKEREFLDGILDQGQIAANLLTQDQALAERIASHPLLLWKAANVRQYRGRA